MKKIFDWIIDKWLAGFITPSIFFILKLYMDLPKESKDNFFGFHWLKEILQTQISFSTVLIIFVIVIVLTRIEKAILKSNYDFLKPPINHFEHYTKDIFGFSRTTWTWHYECRAHEQKFVIADLKPLCSVCDTPMEIKTRYSSNSAECHKCSLERRPYSFSLNERIEDVEKEIIRKIQKNEIPSI
jgi:hypothetical protein